MTNEPLINAAAVTSLVGAIIALLTAFGIAITAEQQAAIMSLFAIVAPFAVAWYARSRVTPLSAPKDEDGQPLTRAGSELPTLKQQRNLERE